MTKAERKQLERIQASGTACSVNLAAYLKAKAPRRKPKSSYRKAKEQERLIGKMVRSEVRAACVKRAGGRCEYCGAPDMFVALEMDHFYGRSRAESVETCWMLGQHCHRAKTENCPDRAMWDAAFKIHCEKYGYPFKPRLIKPARPSVEKPIPPFGNSAEGRGEEVTSK